MILAWIQRSNECTMLHLITVEAKFILEAVPSVELMHPVFTGVPGGVTVGDSGPCCYVLCLLSAITSLCWFQFDSFEHWTQTQISVHFTTSSMNARTPSLAMNALLEINRSVALLLCFGLWGERGGHSSGFSHGIYFVTLWLAEVARMIGSPGPSLGLRSASLSKLAFLQNSNLNFWWEYSRLGIENIIWVFFLIKTKILLFCCYYCFDCLVGWFFVCFVCCCFFNEFVSLNSYRATLWCRFQRHISADSMCVGLWALPVFYLG